MARRRRRERGKRWLEGNAEREGAPERPTLARMTRQQPNGCLHYGSFRKDERDGERLDKTSKETTASGYPC